MEEHKTKYINKNFCRACKSNNLLEVLNLKKQPLANSYHEGGRQDYFPLCLMLCEECFHLQLSVVVKPELMFKNYLYVSGTSKTLNEYFENFVKICENYFSNFTNQKKVLDIACNDATQLDKFKEAQWETYGVDPAENLYKISSTKHNILCDYWNVESAKKINKIFDLVIAQNVFAHVDDIYNFLNACSIVMDENSLLFIQTSQANMIINNEFDTIYHEHLSFFNTKSMKICANNNNFSLVDVLHTDIHGTSYVFVLKKGKHDEEKTYNIIKREEENNLYNKKTYELYANKCKKLVKDVKNKIHRLRKDGYIIVGYGAAAKGNTFLNFAEIDLDYIIDDNPMKWNKLTPGRDIKILPLKKLSEEKSNKIVIVPLAWNFFDEIVKKTLFLKNIKEVKYLKYFPNTLLV